MIEKWVPGASTIGAIFTGIIFHEIDQLIK
jgi:hypothetical protein